MKKIIFVILLFWACSFACYAKEVEPFLKEREAQLQIEEELKRQEEALNTEELIIPETEKPQDLIIEEPTANYEIQYIEGQPLEGILIFEEIVLDNIDSNWYIETKPYATKQILATDTVAPIEAILAYQNNYSTLFQPDATILGVKEFEYGNYMRYKNSKFGVKYENRVSPENFQQIRTLYYEYQRNKFLINAAYKSATTDFLNKKQTAKFKLENSYKLTDSLALKYVYTAGKTTNYSDLLFTLYPFKDDSINFDFGAGQRIYNDKEEYTSRFLFSTEFNF